MTWFLKIAIFMVTGIVFVFPNPQLANAQGQGVGVVRIVELSATANARREDATGRIVALTTFPGDEPVRIFFEMNFTRLTCLGPRSNLAADASTRPFQVYLLTINGEPIVTFNTKCQYSIPGAVGGDFSTSIAIQDADQFLGWFEDPQNDLMHAQVFHETPTSSILVLEGYLD